MKKNILLLIIIFCFILTGCTNNIKNNLFYYIPLDNDIPQKFQLVSYEDSLDLQEIFTGNPGKILDEFKSILFLNQAYKNYYFAVYMPINGNEDANQVYIFLTEFSVEELEENLNLSQLGFEYKVVYSTIENYTIAIFSNRKEALIYFRESYEILFSPLLKLENNVFFDEKMTPLNSEKNVNKMDDERLIFNESFNVASKKMKASSSTNKIKFTINYVGGPAIILSSNNKENFKLFDMDRNFCEFKHFTKSKEEEELELNVDTEELLVLTGEGITFTFDCSESNIDFNKGEIFQGFIEISYQNPRIRDTLFQSKGEINVLIS